MFFFALQLFLMIYCLVYLALWLTLATILYPYVFLPYFSGLSTYFLAITAKFKNTTNLYTEVSNQIQNYLMTLLKQQFAIIYQKFGLANIQQSVSKLRGSKGFDKIQSTMVNIGIVKEDQMNSILDKTEEMTGDPNKLADQVGDVVQNPKEFAKSVVNSYKNFVTLGYLSIYLLFRKTWHLMRLRIS